MQKSIFVLNVFWGPFKFIGNIILNIFKYLSCYENECETTDNRMLLRNLYNSGQMDEEKYHECRERCLDESFDPEELQKPM
jgi:hypothetical protein